MPLVINLFFKECIFLTGVKILFSPFRSEKTFDICFSPHAPLSMDRTKTCLSRSLLVFKKGGEKRMYVLPSFKGYTVDEKLREFRKAIYGKCLEFISFDTSKGRQLLAGYRRKKYEAINQKYN